MTIGTQQVILGAVERLLADLDRWVKGLGLSLDQVSKIYDGVVQENGILAALVKNTAQNVIPFPTTESKLETFETAVCRIRSPEYAAWLSAQPEPSPGNLAQFVKDCRNILPNLREHWLLAAKKGPPHRHGGRRKELDDPVIRQEIREEIKRRRAPGVNLEQLYKSIARRYKVSDTTIKRIRLEGLEQKEIDTEIQ
jgi:hypothetical protein